MAPTPSFKKHIAGKKLRRLHENKLQQIRPCAIIRTIYRNRWEGWEGIVKKYEYKFVVAKENLGLNFSKKVSHLEKKWNELGAEGWKFCTWGNNGVMIFMRETDE